MHNALNSHLQKKAKIYQRKKDVLNLIQSSISGIYLFVFYISGASKGISIMTAQFKMPLSLLIYTLFLSIPLIILLFPISFKKDYLIEKKFGLSSQSVKSWITDGVKGLFLGFILGYPLLLLIFFLFIHTPNYWWAFGVMGMFLFQIFITVIFPIVLLPIFFKQTRVEDEELVKKIKLMFDKAKIKVEGIFSFNLSSRTKKENAALTGLWKTRRVLLGDTLLKNRSIPEVLVVLAHEMGHHVRRHIIKLSIFSLITSIILFFVLSRVMNLFAGFPEDFQKTLSLLPLFMLFSGLISFPVKIGTNAYSRLKEEEADRSALDLTKDPDAFIRVMAGLANTNLLVAYPKKIRVVLFHSHPPIGRRIEFARNYSL